MVDPALKTHIVHLGGVGLKRVALAALGAAICTMLVDLLYQGPHRSEVHWGLMAVLGVWVMLALYFLTRRTAVEKQPAVRELLEQPGSVMRTTRQGRAVRIMLFSGAELRLLANASEYQRLVELLHAHSPSATFT